jgi:hypothetical protein
MERWERLECCLAIAGDEKIGMPSAQSTFKMIGFLEEVHRMQGAQSAPRAPMDRWFEFRPDRDTRTIYVLTVCSLTGRPSVH